MNYSFIAIVFLALIGVGTAVADTLGVSGHYDGRIYTDQAHAGDTRITRDARGKVVGSFTVPMAGPALTGTLTRCRLRDNLLRCRLDDRFGNGTFLARFDMRFCGFEGIWWRRGDRRNPARHYPWTGRRAECL